MELDLFTAEAYRGRGLISACIAQVLRQCQASGLCVHWDAQNKISRNLAVKFGFMELGAYTVYVLPDEGKEEDMGHTLVTRLDREFTQFLHTMMEPYGVNKIPFGRDCDREEANRALEYHMTLFHWAKSQDETYLPRLEGLKVPPARIKVTGIDWMAGEAGSTLVYLKAEPDEGFMDLQREAERALQIRTSAFRHITLAADTDHEKMMRMLREIGEKVIFPMDVPVEGLDLYKIWRPTKKVRSL